MTAAARWASPAAFAVVAACAAVLVGVAAAVDHRLKQGRLNDAEEALWYCTHDGTRCEDADAGSIERRWNRRQLGYEASAGVLVLAAAGAGIAAARRRR